MALPPLPGDPSSDETRLMNAALDAVEQRERERIRVVPADEFWDRLLTGTFETWQGKLVQRHLTGEKLLRTVKRPSGAVQWVNDLELADAILDALGGRIVTIIEPTNRALIATTDRIRVLSAAIGHRPSIQVVCGAHLGFRTINSVDPTAPAPTSASLAEWVENVRMPQWADPTLHGLSGGS